MRTDILIAAIAGALGVAAGPVEKRQSTGLTDADILNFALVLEHFEATFYAQALSNFTAADFTSAGYASNVRNNIATIAADEAQHVSFLTTALTAAGATPVQACSYKFPYSDVKGFLGLAQVFEGVGVSAYLGAGALINSKAYLTAAASILTAEARHSGFIRYTNAYSPFVTEDTPLDPTSVQSLVTPFFASCPNGSAPPFTPYPAATLNSTTTTPGSTIKVSYANSTAGNTTGLYCVFFSGLEQASAPYSNGSCTIPTANSTTGQAYGVISRSAAYNASSVVAGPFILNYDTPNNTASGNSSSGMGSVSNANAVAGSTGAASKTQVALAGFSAVIAAVGSMFLF